MKLLFFTFFITMMLLSQKLEVKADKFTAKNSEKKINFSGHAHVSQGSTRIDANRIIIHFNDDNSTKSYEAVGNVRFRLQKKSIFYEGRCKTLKYIPKENIFLLIGSIKLYDKKRNRNITGENIKINSKNGTFVIKGKKSKQAKLIFNIK